jgi:anti-anti-sigma factor
MIAEEKHGVHIVRLSGDLDLDSYRDLREPLYRLLESEGSKVLIDLSRIRRITTPGWSILLSALRKASETHSTVKLLNLPEHLSQVFLALRLETVFEILDDEELALKTFQPSIFEVDL